jgi:hypothetical protein
MFPHIDDEQRNCAPNGEVLMFFGLQNHEFFHQGLICQDAPAGALDGVGCADELRIKFVVATKVRRECFFQIDVGFATLCGCG